MSRTRGRRGNSLCQRQSVHTTAAIHRCVKRAVTDADAASGSGLRCRWQRRDCVSKRVACPDVAMVHVASCQPRRAHPTTTLTLDGATHTHAHA